MDIQIKQEYIQEIEQKHTTYSLGKILGNSQAIKIFSGDGNITLKTYHKLCEAMDWQFPEQFSITESKKD